MINIVERDQFAANWGTSPTQSTRIPDMLDCSGAPVARLHGQGAFWFPNDERSVDHRLPYRSDLTLVFSASWINLRLRFPPNSINIRYLQFQGVKKMVWGSYLNPMVLGADTWSAASDGIPFPKRMKRERLNGYAQHGTAYIEPPPRWVYPNMYTVNGTNYTDTGVRIYKDEDGVVLDFPAA